MNTVKIFISLYYNKRRPNLKYFINTLEHKPSDIKHFSNKPYQKNAIVQLDTTNLKEHNKITIVMDDKTDNDGDLWCKIREIEVDDIRFEESLLLVSKFTHSMPNTWVSDMKKKGYNILPVYNQSNEIRLNGELEIVFFMPVWQFRVTNCNERTYYPIS